jgi:hypothetical protein
MKTLKVVAGVAVALACLYGFGRLFLAELGSSPAPPGPPGVLLAAPPGFAVVEAGDLDRRAAARELATLLAKRRDEPRLGLHFESAGSELFWLADRGAGRGGQLTERAAGPSGVRTETTWYGDLDRRLAWAAEHGSFDVPSLVPGERKNLYH